jgi:DNA-binding response OmpR family regulator
MPAANETGAYRPCLILAHRNPLYAAEACQHFRRQGWDVYQTHGGPEVRRLARMLEADLVLLDVDLEGESGWLTCAKLKQERPGARVVLVCEDAGGSNRGMAAFVGAAGIMRQQDCLMSLAKTPTGAPMPAAG